MLPQTAATTTTATTTNTNTNTNTTTTLNSSPSVSPRVLQSLRQYPYQTITDLDPIPDRTRLFIGNIPYSSEWRDLKDYLRNAGSILRVEIPSESDGASKGFAVATYASEPDAVRAIELFNGVMFQGRPLTVRFDRFPVRSRDVRTEYYKSPTGQQEEEEEQGEEKGTIQADNEDGIAESIVGKRVEALKIPEGPVLQKEKDDDRRFEDEARNLIESLSVNNM
jgi:RNA recognition motif-containing protein